MKKISILQIEPVSDFGGVSNYIFALAKNLPVDFFEIHFTASFGGGFENVMKNIGCRIFPSIGEYSFFNFFSGVKILRNYIKENNIKIVHAHTLRSGLIIAIVAKRLNIKFIYTGHGIRWLQKKTRIEKFFFKKLEGYVFSRATAISTLSRLETHTIINTFGFENKIHTIPYSFHFEEHGTNDGKKIREKYNIANNKMIITMVGRVTEQKNPGFFLSVAEAVLAKKNDVQFVWAGDGDLLNEVWNETIKKGLGKDILWLGRVDKNDLHGILRQSDVFFFTSNYEGLPISILEAMAAGISIVAPNVGSVGEVIIHQKTGMLYHKNNFKEAGLFLITVLDKPSLREFLGNTARAFVTKNYMPEKRMAESFSDIYNKLDPQ
jgi:glycosyltransferase involved in cell wall biosynthesis